MPVRDGIDMAGMFYQKVRVDELFTPKITRAQEVEWQAACRLFSTKLQCSFCANFLQCERQHLIFIQQGLWSLPVVFFSSFKKKKKVKTSRLVI